MSQVAQLSKAAAKLLLRYLETDGATEPAAQAMIEAGIARSDYYRARNELQVLGFTDRRGNLIRFVNRVEQPLDNDYVPPEMPAEAEAEAPLSKDMPLRQRAMQADLMDDSGSWSSSNSPRRKRRLVQIEVLQDAWDEFFHESLTPDNAKDFLGWLDDSAEAVLLVFEDAKRRVDTGYVQKPLAWLRTKYEKKAKEAQAAPQVKPAAIGPVDGDTMMSDYTPATKRKAKKIEAYLASRGNDGWEE